MLTVFGTEMHLVTFLFVVIESIMFLIQLVYFLFRPQNKDRLRFLILLALLIFYNLTGGLFPDPKLPISIVLQNIFAFGGGFIMASYIPYYFYKAYDLRNLRFQALYGIFLFLLLPFAVFFCFFYALNGDIDFAVKWGIVIPLVYAFYMLGSIFIELKRKYQKGEISNLLEASATYCAIIPWASLPIMAYLHTSQLTEVSFNNGGFLIISILYLNQEINYNHGKKTKLAPQFDFDVVLSELANLKTETEKITCLINWKTKYLQNKPIYNLPGKIPFDHQIYLEIEKINLVAELDARYGHKMNSNFVKIRWLGNLNVLGDIFYQKVHQRQPDGKPYLELTVQQTAEFICQTYLDKFGNEISVETMKTILNPSRPEKRPKSNKQFDIQSLLKS